MRRPTPTHRSQRELESDIFTPQAQADRERLSKLAAARLREAENQFVEDQEESVEAEDEEFNQPSIKRAPDSRTKKVRGPLGMQERQRRVEAADRMMKEKGLDINSLIRRDFDPDSEPDEQPQGPRKIISNSAKSRPGRVAGPVDSPEISEVSLLTKRLDEQAARIKELEQNKGIVDPKDQKSVSRLASRRKNYDAEYELLEPPSKCTFYDFSPQDTGIKKIDVTIQSAITAARRSRDISAYIDAIAATFKDLDIRDFTNQDWWYILYYHKFTSYPRSSLILNWTSKYGNDNAYKIQQSDLNFIYPKITREQFLERYDSKGLCVPRLRDWELLNTPNDLTQEDREIYLRAQYFKGDSVEEKVDHYFDSGETVEMLELINQLNIESAHGVLNTVNVVDAQFDPIKYLASREAHLRNLRNEAQRYKDNLIYFNTISEEADEVEKEINDKNDILEKGGQVQADVETRPVIFDALDIFPLL